MAPGTVVQLKSGGPYMTVRFTDNGERGQFAKCVWFAGDELKHDTFGIETIAEVT